MIKISHSITTGGQMSGRLENKAAVITGTASGQGRAAAILFATEGYKVVGCDLRVEGAQETKERRNGHQRTITC
jgi:NAD(P)-dependent dehydrogenase (short-subunit alcohol dehydrogenase family)